MPGPTDHAIATNLRDRIRALFAASLACIILIFSSDALSQTDTSTTVAQDDVDRAVKVLEADPNFAPTRKMRTLRWSGDKPDAPKRGSWGKWIADFFAWIAQASRVFVWLLIALLVAIIALYLWRFTQTFGRKPVARLSDAPTHVRDLDIRPESLPDDIGAAAWALWQEGQHRNALSLLYRGLLSRLAHAHQVPIKDSTTEGDCLTLAQRHLSEDRIPYVKAMIKSWQRAIYGGAEPSDEQMQQLCSQFAAALEAPAGQHGAQA